MTFGSIAVTPNAANVIPGETVLRQELRDLDAEIVERLGAASETLAHDVADGQGLGLEIRRVSFDRPAVMSSRIADRIEAACVALGHGYRRMSSGAGHDAQVMAGLCEAGMIFVPSRGGRSHRGDEVTDEDDLVTGANVLLHSLKDLVS